MTIKLREILLADDSARDAAMVMDAFNRYKIANRVTHVRDGAEALDYIYQRGAFAGAQNNPPAVLLLDLKMPRVDGLEVLRQLRSDPRFKFLPVVVMTSSREEQDLMKSYELGVNGYVVKPVDFLEFVEAVKLVGGYWAMVNEPPPRSTSLSLP